VDFCDLDDKIVEAFKQFLLRFKSSQKEDL